MEEAIFQSVVGNVTLIGNGTSLHRLTTHIPTEVVLILVLKNFNSSTNSLQCCANSQDYIHLSLIPFGHIYQLKETTQSDFWQLSVHVVVRAFKNIKLAKVSRYTLLYCYQKLLYTLGS